MVSNLPEAAQSNLHLMYTLKQSGAQFWAKPGTCKIIHFFYKSILIANNVFLHKKAMINTPKHLFCSNELQRVNY